MDSQICLIDDCNHEIFEVKNKWIFHCPKNEQTNWYTLDDNKKLWNQEKIKLFWEEIRETLYESPPSHQLKKIIKFSRIIFPTFEEYLYNDSGIADILSGNFLNKHPSSIKFELPIVFDNCIFLDDVNFSKYDFNHYVKFINCQCEENLNFDSCIFGEELDLGINIGKNLNFLSCKLHSTNLLLYGTVKADFKTITVSESLFLHITNNSSITIRDSDIKHLNIVNIEEEQKLTLIASLVEKVLPTNSSHNEINIKNSKIRSLEIEDLYVDHFILKRTNINDYANLHFTYIDWLEICEIKLNGYLSIKNDYFNYTSDGFSQNGSVLLENIELAENSKIVINDFACNNLTLNSLNLIGTNNLNISNLYLNQLSITNCILNDAIINNIDFMKQSYTIISNSQLNNCHFSNIRWENTNLDSLDTESCNQIKHSYDSRGNVIEANKFYAAEMKAKSQEKKNWKDNIIFKLHYLSSNHSQDWFRALLWIIFFTTLYAVSICDKLSTSLDLLFIYYYELKAKIIVLHNNDFIAMLMISLMALVLILPIIKKYLNLNLILGFSTILLIISYFHCCQNANTSELVSYLNFSSLFKDTSKTFILFLLNLVQAYLVYQFIVSIRQNTRRK